MLVRDPRQQPALLVFTDLDASLLDAESYSWSAATPALERLRRLGAPIVFVTSKTRSEVEVLRRQMDIDEPFVVENGGGIFFPERYAARAPTEATPVGLFRRIRLGITYTEIRRFVSELPPELGFRGFGDLSDAEVAALADLPPQGAARARQREFTEPFFLTTGEEGLERLSARARDRGLAIVRGGRFHHLIGSAQDKGKAVRVVTGALSAELVRPVTVGLGDSPNDLPMLDEVDLAVVIPHVGGSVIDPGRPAITAPSPGSRGWNEAMNRILDLYESPPREGFAGTPSPGEAHNRP